MKISRKYPVPFSKKSPTAVIWSGTEKPDKSITGSAAPFQVSVCHLPASNSGRPEYGISESLFQP
ncbi:MAG: hypothetical protein IIB82_11440 [Bacteroidetes bacterium]|nr:hypothetical protein [Bacteroidota bacterium]